MTWIQSTTGGNDPSNNLYWTIYVAGGTTYVPVNVSRRIAIIGTDTTKFGGTVTLNTSCSIYNCQFIKSHPLTGGNLVADSSDINIQRCKFKNNLNGNTHYLIRVNGSAVVSNCSFTTNIEDDAASVYCIYNSAAGDLNVLNNQVIRNNEVATTYYIYNNWTGIVTSGEIDANWGSNFEDLNHNAASGTITYIQKFPETEHSAEITISGNTINNLLTATGEDNYITGQDTLTYSVGGSSNLILKDDADDYQSSIQLWSTMTDGQQPELEFYKQNGYGVATKLADGMGNINWRGLGSSSTIGAQIEVKASETWGATNGVDMTISTIKGGSALKTDRLVFDSKGHNQFYGQIRSNDGLGVPLTEISTSTTLSDKHYTVIVTGLNVDIQLPLASAYGEIFYIIKTRDSETHDVDTVGTDRIFTTVELSGIQLQAVGTTTILHSNGVDTWYLIGTI